MRKIKTFLNEEVTEKGTNNRVRVGSFIENTALTGENTLNELNEVLKENNYNELVTIDGVYALNVFKLYGKTQRKLEYLADSLSTATEERFAQFNKEIKEKEFFNAVELISHFG